MDGFDKRYEIQEEWETFGTGRLARAKDMKLNREVLLSRLPEPNEARLREALNRLRYAARFADKRFLHILDGYTEDRELFAVLTDDKGMLLTEHWHNLQWSGTEILRHVRELAAGIRESRKERMVRFSVSADNVWVDINGKLRFINYWTEAESDSNRDIHGLGYLIYQLCGKTVKKPSSMTAYCEMLRMVLTDLPGGSAEEAVQWACSAFHPSCTLKEFEAGLDRLLTPRVEEEEPVVAAVKKRKFPELRLRIRPIHMVGVVALLGFFGFIWAASGGLEATKGTDSKPAVKPAVTLATSAEPDENDPSPSASASPKATSKSSTAPTKSPKPSPAGGAQDQQQPAGAQDDEPADAGGAVDAAPGKVPNLVGMDRQSAEKLALQSGLKYQYMLAADSAAQGTVFKQDLNPGDSVSPGTKITFWVSKGQ